MNKQSVLHNIRILDFTWVLAGPYATRLLADFGAEVIKVQPLLSAESDDAFARAYYNAWNRNKRGITLDMSRPEGVSLAKRLVGKCDAVIENFTPRVMANWGLDYENLRKVKRDIILVSMSAMGQSGPWKDYAGFGPTVQAFSGITGLTGFPGKTPAGIGFSYADHVAGLYASLALLGALEHRRKTGEGQHVDISQVEAMTGLFGSAVLEYGMTGKVPAPAGNTSPRAAPHDIYRCSDGRWCAIAVFSDGEWQGFAKALGDLPWASDGKFTTVQGRLANREELDGLVAAWAREHPADEVMALLQGNGVAAGVVQDAADLARDPQLRARGFFTGDSDASPVKLSETPAVYSLSASSPGRDNDSIYGGLLGIGEEELAGLRENGVI